MTREHGKNWRWVVCGLLLLATMLNYMDRQTLSQAASDISSEFALSNQDYGKVEKAFGLAFAAGGIVIGFIADRVSLRWLYPGVLLAWSAAGLATGWAKGFEGLLLCRVFLGFFEAGQWPCALAASQRLLSRSDRAFGNSLIQSGASIGAVITPLVVQAMVSDVPGSWRGPFRVIGVLGGIWTLAWLTMIRQGDLARVEPTAVDPADFITTDRATFIRRFLVVAVVVVSINLCWHFYRAWLPKMLREQYGYTREFVNYFTSCFYIATDVGCIGAGLAIKYLSSRGRSVHGSRVFVFLGCSLLTALGAIISLLPAGPLLLGLLLLLGAGALGLFPIYYSLTQELSTRHQGSVIGWLACIAWLTSSLMHEQVGRWVDRTGSYGIVLTVTGLLPLFAVVVFAIGWNRDQRIRPLPHAARSASE